MNDHMSATIKTYRVVTDLDRIGATYFRRIMGFVDSCNESTWDCYTPAQIVRIVEACWASKWDLYADELLRTELDFAAKHGKLSKACERRLDKMWGG